MQLDCDVLIVGAGPAGLALAAALVGAGLSVTVLDSQDRATLAAPAEDGREIALTHSSVALLRTLGQWQRLADSEIGTIRAAQVVDGPLQQAALHFSTPRNPDERLGWIVPNHALRRVGFEVAASLPGLRIIDNTRVDQVGTAATHAEVSWGAASGTPQRLRARLLVAADSRFSQTRRQLGIGADMLDFGRTMVVCRMQHTLAHQGIAYECFGYDRTLAVLPLPGDVSSVVVTTGTDEAQRLLALPPAEWATLIQQQFLQRLGPMQLQTTRHAYPLVAVYAHRFAGTRSVLVGDAAVGMHPVTAHGYNLGLAGVATLAQVLAGAQQLGQDIGAPALLARYETQHRRQTRLIYHGTNAVARLYADTRAPQRLLRNLVLRGAQHLPPLKAAITARLH